MDHEQAVVRLPYVKNRPIKLGTVLAQEGDLYLVKWDDGGEEEFHLGDYETLCVRGSLIFASLVDPDGLRAAFDADPAAVALRALQESPAPMTGKELKAVLTGLGIGPDRFKDTWAVVRKQLTEDARVAVVGKGLPMTFAWADRPASEE